MAAEDLSSLWALICQSSRPASSRLRRDIATRAARTRPAVVRLYTRPSPAEPSPKPLRAPAGHDARPRRIGFMAALDGLRYTRSSRRLGHPSRQLPRSCEARESFEPSRATFCTTLSLHPATRAMRLSTRPGMAARHVRFRRPTRASHEAPGAGPINSRANGRACGLVILLRGSPP